MKTFQSTAAKLLCAALLAGAAASANAADAKKTATPPGLPDAAAMAQAVKLGMPGAGHKVLEPLAGTFNAVTKMWMDPSAPAQESKGTSANTWILGGRFLKQTYSGQFNNQAFEGSGLTGFDNVKNVYQAVWVDNMSSGMMTAEGTYDAGSKTIKQSGHFSCPMTGEKNRAYRSELKIVDNDHHTYTSYSTGADGKEMKDLEITYTRAK